MKADAARGPVGAWARQARLTKGWKSAETAVTEIRKATGHRMRADYLRGIESGNQRPGAETIDALERAYGSPAPPLRPEAPPTGDIGELVSVMRDLVEEMRRDREREDERIAVTVRAVMAALQGSGAPAASGARSESAVPQRRPR